MSLWHLQAPDNNHRLHQYLGIHSISYVHNRLDAEIIETDCVEEFKQKLAPFMYMVK